MAGLSEYEETYKLRLEGFQRELRELEEFEKAMVKSGEQIDGTLAEKDRCRSEAFAIKQDINGLKTKRDNTIANREYIQDKQAKVEAEFEDLQTQLLNCEKKIAKLEQEKKKAAAGKKFKEAAKF